MEMRRPVLIRGKAKEPGPGGPPTSGVVRLAAVLGLALAAGSAADAVTTNTVTYSALWGGLEQGQYVVSLQQLDTNQPGVQSVLSIQVRIVATNMAEAIVENLSRTATNRVSAGLVGSFLAYNPDLELDLGIDTLYRSETNFLAPNSGTNWIGPDTAFFSNMTGAGAASNLVTSTFASLYFGSGSFDVYIDATSSVLVNATTRYQSTYNELGYVGLAEVSYTYTTPEPRAVFALGAVGAVLATRWWARRRRRGTHRGIR